MKWFSCQNCYQIYELSPRKMYEYYEKFSFEFRFANALCSWTFSYFLVIIWIILSKLIWYWCAKIFMGGYERRIIYTCLTRININQCQLLQSCIYGFFATIELKFNLPLWLMSFFLNYRILAFISSLDLSPSWDDVWCRRYFKGALILIV